MSYQYLEIVYDNYPVRYQLRKNSLVDRWANQLKLAQQSYQIDDPKRFYGFGSLEDQTLQALNLINSCINTINQFEPIIARQLTQIDDQDTLNYLHHIFEEYHGLLDQQTHEFWQRAPLEVRKALADLNVLVHRCEDIYRFSKPRHVVTYYGLPKTEQLDFDDYKLFETNYQFGTVYLNYVEIGKTLEDLAIDNDQWIGDDAFRPFKHFSADFNVKFFTSDSRQVEWIHANIKEYYEKNRVFFESRGLEWGHPYLKPGAIPLADIVSPEDNLIDIIKNKQIVTAVNLI